MDKREPDGMKEVVERLERSCVGWTREGAQQAAAVAMFEIADVRALLADRRNLVDALREAKTALEDGDETEAYAIIKSALTGSDQ